MPQLPDLPPLPQDYQPAGTGDGAYAGLVGGLAVNGAVAGTIGIVAGAVLAGDAVIVGVEGMALLQPGSSSIEGALRLGLPLSDGVAAFSQASLGFDSANGAVAGLGGGLEFQLTDTLTWRAQYRHAFDLSGAAGKGVVLTGAVFRF